MGGRHQLDSIPLNARRSCVEMAVIKATDVRGGGSVAYFHLFLNVDTILAEGIRRASID